MYVTIVSCSAGAANQVIQTLTGRRLAVPIAAIEGVRSFTREGLPEPGENRTVLLLLTAEGSVDDLVAEVNRLSSESEPPPVVAFPEAGGLSAFLDRAAESLAPTEPARGE